MGDERYPRSSNPQADYYGRRESGDYGRDYGSGRDYTSSSARDYQAAGRLGGDNDAHRDWGSRDFGNDRYGQRDRHYGANRGYDQGRSDYSQGRSDYGQTRGDYGQGRGDYGQNRGYGSDQSRQGGDYHGSYAHDGRRFEDVGRYRDQDDDNRRGRMGSQSGDRSRDYGRQPQGYDYDDRGFFARAGDEVRSWFGDEDAERRRQRDEREDDRRYGSNDERSSDSDYHDWRRGQMDAFDRDYSEYRQENRDRFRNEFSTWRTARQGQRDSLNQVEEHMDVVGSDGEHVGTVDKVRGDRIILTKNDADAGGHHHSIPSRWIQTVDSKVTLSKTAKEAKDHWRDEERNQAMFGDHRNEQQNRSNTDRTTTAQSSTGQSSTGQSSTGQSSTGTDLNKSFSGTY